MSANHCSLAIDLEGSNFSDEDLGTTLTLVVNKRYVSIKDSSARVAPLHDVVELSGTITISF